MKRVLIMGKGFTGTTLLKDEPRGIVIINEQEKKMSIGIKEIALIANIFNERVYQPELEVKKETTAVFHPKKHTSQSYRSQQRKKKKRRKKR